MELRRDIRYRLDNTAVLRQAVGDVRCRFEFDEGLEVKLEDLSLRGFGYRIDSVGGSQVDTIKTMEYFLVTMFFGDDSMAADVRNVWSSVFFDNGKMSIKGGVALEVLSPEDRLKLSGIIEKIRGGL
ncbi:MAG: hypothetical protein JW807_03430 [Spirochaetes bacterium]|nr:hypothetical protein [Spirochaetota bacterium]